MRRLAVASACAALLAAGTDAATAAPIDDTARFLAGKGAAPDSSLADHARIVSYLQYAEDISSGWKQFEQPNLERMRAWWTDRGLATASSTSTSSTVFYPFSGPDVGNALVFFPDADSYLMFGLEAPGAIPDVQAMDDDAIATGLTELKSSLSTILQVNYFFTKAMEKKLGKGAFTNVSSLLLFFLAINDCEVTSAKTISIGSRIPGVEIAFRRHHGKQQTIRYFMVNVADASLAKSSSDFVPYLQKQGRVVTMLKSASYLMHKEGIGDPEHFEKIRALILAQSDFIIQDDSCVPLRLFTRDAWKLQFHGKYEAPTPEFGKFLQKDLKVEMQRNSTGILPFSYGYAYKQGESNVMTATRVR